MRKYGTRSINPIIGQCEESGENVQLRCLLGEVDFQTRDGVVAGTRRGGGRGSNRGGDRGVEYVSSSKRERGSPELGVERARGSVMRREVVAGKARR